MKEKVLLIFPPIRVWDKPRNFPVGLGHIAAVLRNIGFEVEVLDINGTRISKEKVIERIKKEDYTLVGIGGLITVYGYTKWLTFEIKKYRPEVKIVLGGSVATPIPHLIFSKTLADVIVMGEGERTVEELFPALLKKNVDLSKIKGIAYRTEGKDFIITEPRPLIEDLDSVPFPAWELFPMDVYLSNPIVGVGRDLDMITSRGCPFGCIYCYQQFGRRYRYMSPPRMIEELREIVRRYKVDFISFQEDCFVVNKKRVYEFCDLLDREPYKVRWSCDGRVNICDKELLERMKASGCVSVSYGIESGSQKILNRLNKGTTVEMAKKVLKIAKEVGIRAPTSFMIGAPGETRETVKETIDFCIQTGIRLQSAMFVTPYPGTRLYEEVKQKGLITPENEEEFILKLNDALNFTINLTDMPDEELIKLRDWMIKEVQRHVPEPSKEEKEKQLLDLYGERLYKEYLKLQQDESFRKHREEHGFNESL